ncbi:MAG: peptide ABC transporter substrate-binding protein [Oscillospiraceae bacterium]|nr:peptide ABC transporter substrate-binding protein [Oscillospiraceae bacterium]
MAKRLKLVCNAILLAATLLSVAALSGCRNASDGSDGIFVIDIEVNPKTLDPQTAVDKTARQIIANIFDGLLRMDEEGAVIAGVSETYTVSDDALTYTFYLREGVTWRDSGDFNRPCTADDFVFAFERLFNPAIRSLNAADYYSIQNARQIHAGELDSDSLGVSAKDDYTLIITLEQPDANFPILLTMPPAFPVNRDFFKRTQGRYGLVYADCAIASNGAFILQDWVYDPHWYYENRIILTRNNSNNHTAQFGQIYPRRVEFLMDRGRAPERFANGDTDCIVLSGETAADLIDKGFSHSGTDNSVWGMGFNTSGVFKNADLRRALALATDSSTLVTERSGVSAANRIIPDSVQLEKTPDAIAHDADEAARLYESVSRLVAANPVLIVPVSSESDVILSQVRSIAQQWQATLGLFCEIVPLSAEEFARAFADGSYDIAAVNAIATYNSPAAVLEPIMAWSGAKSSKDAAKHLRRARTETSPAKIDEHLLAAESALLQSAAFIPFCFVTEYFFTDNECQDLHYNAFTGGIEFRNSRRI